MAASNLPKIGVEAIVEGIKQYVKDIDTVNKITKESGEVSAAAAKKTGALPKGLDEAAKSFDNIRQKIGDFVKQSVPFGNQLGGFIDKLVAIPLPALAAVGAVVALGAAFIELGNRGAALVPLAESFDRLTASVGISSQTLLIDLRKAANGTVSDFDLIKRANLALVGSTGEFGKEFGQKLPQVLAAARAAAKATGQDVDFLFQSLVSGIKRASPMLIDNTGIVLKLGAANEELAKKLGKSVTELTSEEKQIATLNATVAAGAALISSLGDAQESNAEKLARSQATITNTFDSLAVAVQPAFGIVLDAVQKVLDIFQQLAVAVGPIFGGIASIVAEVFSTVISIVTSIVQPIIDTFSSIAPYIALVFQFIAKVVGAVGKVIADIVGGIVKFLQDVAKNFFGLDLTNLGPKLFNGAAAAFGSFANGIIKVANKLIFPAVIAIAKFIADFLIGFSPPKEGPLSVIDKGGENLMLAWLDGISGVSLDPVKKVAQEVSDALGVIGTKSLSAVNQRLAQLDQSLLPFQNRLEIVKANFEALSEPAKLALDAIDRETTKLQDAVSQGDPQAVERLKLLDAQRQTIQEQVDLQQGLVDRAQIQLGLAQAQQAPERALLTIRQKYLTALAKAQGTTSTAGGGAADKIPKTPKGSGTGGINPNSAGGAPALPTSDMPSVLDLIGGQGAVDAAAQGLSDSFMGAIDQTGLQDFAQNSLDLSTQIGRIKSVDLGAKISDKFQGLTDAFNPSVAGSIANVVYQFFNGTQDNPNSLAGIFYRAGDSLATVKDAVLTNINSVLSGIFDPTLEGSAMNSVLTLVGTAIGNDNLPGDVATFFSGLPTRIQTALADLDTIVKSAFTGIISFFTTSEPGSLGDMINQAVGFFSSLPVKIIDGLRGIGAAIYSAFAVPVIQAINGLIGLVEKGVSGLINEIANFVGGISDALGDASPQFLKDTVANLHGAANSVAFGRISTELPAFLQAPVLAGATGGIFSKGFMTVGEKGTELMYNASKMGVVPHEITAILTSLESILAQPQAMPIYSGGNTTMNSSNSTFNFNGVQGDNDARRRYNYLRAGMK